MAAGLRRSSPQLRKLREGPNIIRCGWAYRDVRTQCSQAEQVPTVKLGLRLLHCSGWITPSAATASLALNDVQRATSRDSPGELERPRLEFDRRSPLQAPQPGRGSQGAANLASSREYAGVASGSPGEAQDPSLARHGLQLLVGSGPVGALARCTGQLRVVPLETGDLVT